jgi:eukaryotic-like serine/threonine-protein kinase
MPKAKDRIGPYQLINKLGAGAFGEVWLAQDFSSPHPREVAVKMPIKSDVDLDALLQEATVWARVTGHPNVLEFLAARVFDGQVTLVSEYASDGSLEDWLKRRGGRAPSIEAAVEMTLGILAGLEHLHSRSIIHRDLKPDNVLLQGATPRLADFGISRVFKSTSKSAVTAGTPSYMAPEAFNRKRNQQTDLWSVGVMLYQMLSGRLPFEGNDMAELYGAILNENPEPLPPAVPEWLRQAVAKALTKEPSLRYQSAPEMREALRQFERAVRQPDEAPTERIVGRPDADEQRIDQEKEPERPDEEGRRQETRSLPSRRLLIAGAALAALIVVAYLIGRRLSASSIETPRSQRAFSFETITLDGDGREASRNTGHANYFVVEPGNGATLEMVEIPGGSFMMGSPMTEANRNSDEAPRHSVNVPSFWMGKFEVTQKQWLAVIGRFPTEPVFRGDDQPVEKVSWNDAQEFLAALNRKLGLQSKDRRYQYRLPSEAEWEYAARAGTDTPFAFGETITPQIVNYDGDYPYASAPKGVYRQKTVAVGSLGVANAFGLFDMHGNVWEWCEDVYHEGYNEAPTDGSAWLSGGDSSVRTLRGGSWGNNGWYCRSAIRFRNAPGGGSNFIGFRVVVSARNL